MLHSSEIKATAKYRMPGEQEFYCLSSSSPFQKTNLITDGFIFSNFETNEKYTLNNAQVSVNKWIEFNSFYLPEIPPTKESDYLDSVNQIIDSINSNKFQKVVYSRIKSIPKKSDFNLEKIFNSLCHKYPDAFVYCLSSQETGTWIGASPELLISQNNEGFKTKSLAGTRVSSAKWTEKERNEQQLVTDYISNVLKEFSCKIEVSEPYDAQAGEVFHLKSDINFKLNSENQISELIGKIHPTPAICGIPTKKAKEFITQLETHNRDLYTGFIGPFGQNNHKSLFVNLRCMQVHENQLSIYVGGGIMEDSDANNEWQETENKAKTMLSVL